MSTLKDQISSLSLAQRTALEQQLMARAATEPAPAPALDNTPQPLSFAQESLWFFDQFAPGQSVYNMPQAFRVRGRLDLQALSQAFASVVTRHAALRTRFFVQNGAPMQQVEEPDAALAFLDLSQVSDIERDKEVVRLVDEEARRPFHLADEAVIRGRLVRLEQTEHLFLLSLHHIVTDFDSLQIIYRDLSTLYQAHLAQQGPAETAGSPIFAHWAAKQRQMVESGSVKSLLAEGKQRLIDVPLLELPSDRPTPAVRSFRGARRLFEIPPALATPLREIAQTHRVTLYTVLLGAFETLLNLYSGQEQFLIGSPFSLRDTPELENTVGLFVNTVLLRADFSSNPTFVEILDRVRSAATEALSYRELPFEKLIEALNPSRRTGSSPVCQVMFQYLPAKWPVPSFAGVSTELLPTHTGTAKFDMTLSILEGGAGLDCELEYSRDLFDPETMVRMVGHFLTLLDGLASQPDRLVAELPLLTSEEREQLLIAWNRTQIGYPRQSSVHAIFEAQARLNPERLALRFGSEVVTYGALNRAANQLARFLQGQGVQRGEAVALAVERSPQMIISLLAILKAGGTYVPLDPKYPAERLQWMLHDSGASTLIVTGKTDHLSDSQLRLVHLDRAREEVGRASGDDLPTPVSAEDLAYIMYTSGSTGQPKGVAVPHRAVVRLVKGANYARFDPSDVFLQFAPLSFDASTFEIWGALLNGASLALYPPVFESIEQFERVLEQYGVTTLWLTAGLFHQIVDDRLRALRGVRQLLAGGDVLSPAHVQRVLRELPHCELINGYGPTENTTFTCCYRFPRDWAGSSAPIGRPVSNTQVYVLNPALNLVPVGVAGELFIGGDGLARGYVNSPELTASRFVAHPFSTEPNARLYRTGDRVRWRPDGTLEFLGRSDDQVKINGFRIHLSEVEAALLQHIPGVLQAAVVAHANEAHAKKLLAYVVLQALQSPMELRELLRTKLPAFMVPSQIFVLPQLPLTPNGKIDRRALPPPESQPVAPASHPEFACTPIQQQITAVWKEVFGRESIHLDESFFDLGGHSLLATRVVSRLNRALNTSLSIATLFQAPTIRALAEKVSSLPAASGAGPIPRRPRA